MQSMRVRFLNRCLSADVTVSPLSWSQCNWLIVKSVEAQDSGLGKKEPRPLSWVPVVDFTGATWSRASLGLGRATSPVPNADTAFLLSRAMFYCYVK